MGVRLETLVGGVWWLPWMAVRLSLGSFSGPVSGRPVPVRGGTERELLLGRLGLPRSWALPRTPSLLTFQAVSFV